MDITAEKRRIQKDDAVSIESWRRALRFSKMDVARRLGISATSAGKKLNGELPFRGTEIRLLCDWWGLTYEQLTSFEKYRAQIESQQDLMAGLLAGAIRDDQLAS